MQLSIKAAGGGNKQCTEQDGTAAAPPGPHSLALKQKAIYLLNTPSGLFIAVVHAARPPESQCPPSCLLHSGKSKWLFHWMRYVKPLGQIAGASRACCFATFCWESVGVVYHKRHIGSQGGVHAVEVACHRGGFIFKWEFSGEAWLMALYRCTSTCLVSPRPLSVNAVCQGCWSVMHT